MRSKVDTIHEKRKYIDLYDRCEALKLQTMPLNRQSRKLDAIRKKTIPRLEKDLRQQTKYLQAVEKNLSVLQKEVEKKETTFVVTEAVLRRENDQLKG